MNGNRPLLFVNTFEPVVPLYRDLAAAWAGPVTALVSQGDYRPQGEALDRHMAVQRVWVPRLLRRNRRWCAVFYWLLAPWMILRYSRTTIVLLSQPPLFYLVGSLIGKLRKSNVYILHIMDLYPNLLCADGLVRQGGLTDRLLRSWAQSAFRRARHIIVIGRCMKDRIVEMGVCPDSISTIPNWAHRDQRISDGESRFREAHGLTDKLVVMYAGNMGKFHEFATIVQVANRLESYSELRFVFVGEGSRRPELESARACGAENILLLPHQPSIMLSTVLRSADIHYISLRSGIEGLMVPSKLYGILSAGRPVIYEGNSQGEVARVIKETGCGQVVDPGEVDGLQQAIQRYLSDPGRAIADGRRAAEVYANSYRPEASVRLYTSLMTESC